MPLSEEFMKNYKVTIGIETHVQLKTNTKLFSGAGNDARDAEPNTLISHIDTAMPGALPVLNEKAVELAVRAAFALNTEPQKQSYFERKHYFYPDSPAGYQISQLAKPIIVGGSVVIRVGNEEKTIAINRVQLEADAGKNTHPTGTDYSLVDLNRAGTPLLEIVSEPEIHSAAEAKAYVRELYLLMKYADISNVDLYHGNMRFDVNVSVSSDPNKLGKRTEIKNLNSFRSVEAASNYEIERQINLYESGETVAQETRGWDEDKQQTTSQRSKEEAQDYRYFPDPDLPPLELSDEFIDKVKSDLSPGAAKIREQLIRVGVDKMAVEAIIEYPELAYRLQDPLISIIETKLQKRIADWFSNEIIRQLSENPNINLKNSIEDTPSFLNIEQLIKLAYMVEDSKLSSSAAKTIIAAYWTDLYDVEEIASKMNILQVSDTEFIEKIVSEVIAENPNAAEDIKTGEMKAIGFLVGQVMAKSKGQANPGIAQQIIKKQLGV